MVQQRGQAAQAIGVGGQFRRGDRRGLAESDDAGAVDRAAAQAAFLAPADDQRRQAGLQAPAGQKRADPLGAVDLVCAQHREVDLASVQRHRDLARGLRDVAEEQGAGAVRELGGPPDVRDRAGLAVGRHDGDQHDIR